jgi:hypothetical protein
MLIIIIIYILNLIKFRDHWNSDIFRDMVGGGE